MSKVKLAATIMLGRDKDGALEILLLKRNKALAFAGGLWVFPGGKIEPAEVAQSKDELAAAKLAAIREIKEEANLDLETEQLLFFRHWTTPVIEPRRYATYFFFGAADFSASEVTIDDSEIKAHQWLSPQAALDELAKGNLAMMPPTIMSLQLIRKCSTVKAASALIAQENAIFILPVLQMVKGKMVCMYKGDAGYATGNGAELGARHRLTLDMTNGANYFEFKDCEAGIEPVNGGMHL